MRLLRLPSYFEPEKAASTYLWNNLSDAFAQAGIEMVVYTPMPTRGVSKEVREAYKRKPVEITHGGMMTTRRFKLFNEGRNTFMRALRYFIQDVKQFNFAVFSKEGRSCDCIFFNSTPPTQAAMVALVKKIRKIPTVYSLQDIFPDSLVSTGLTKKGSLLWKIGRSIENFSYRHCDKIVVISEEFKRNLLTKGVPEEKIEVIPNWVESETVYSVPRDENKLVEKCGIDKNAFVVTYCGNIGMTQNINLLIEIMEEFLTEKTDIHLVLFGDGAYYEALENIIKDKNLVNTKLFKFQPYEDIAHVFSLGDASLVISNPGVGTSSVPSKTWSIMSASRPVIASFDGKELHDIIEKSESGLCVPAGNKEALKDAIMKLYADRALCERYGQNGRQYVEENLTREKGVAKYVEVCRSCCK